jgi:ribosomal protein S18 acetylase RimI-like enzyme
VRKATLDDVDAIVRLNAIVQDLHHRELPDRFKPPDPAAYTPIVRAWLTEENRIWFLAELEGGEPVGYALAVRRERPENPLTRRQILVELEQIAVDPVVRRQGIGAALAREVIDHARLLGVRAVELSVHAFNEEAQAFFSTIGFKNILLRMSVPLGESLP